MDSATQKSWTKLPGISGVKSPGDSQGDKSAKSSRPRSAVPPMDKVAARKKSVNEAEIDHGKLMVKPVRRPSASDATEGDKPVRDSMRKAASTSRNDSKSISDMPPVLQKDNYIAKSVTKSRTNSNDSATSTSKRSYASRRGSSYESDSTRQSATDPVRKKSLRTSDLNPDIDSNQLDKDRSIMATKNSHKGRSSTTSQNSGSVDVLNINPKIRRQSILKDTILPTSYAHKTSGDHRAASPERRSNLLSNNLTSSPLCSTETIRTRKPSLIPSSPLAARSTLDIDDIDATLEEMNGDILGGLACSFNHPNRGRSHNRIGENNKTEHNGPFENDGQLSVPPIASQENHQLNMLGSRNSIRDHYHNNQSTTSINSSSSNIEPSTYDRRKLLEERLYSANLSRGASQTSLLTSRTSHTSVTSAGSSLLGFENPRLMSGDSSDFTGSDVLSEYDEIALTTTPQSSKIEPPHIKTHHSGPNRNRKHSQIDSIPEVAKPPFVPRERAMSVNEEAISIHRRKGSILDKDFSAPLKKPASTQDQTNSAIAENVSQGSLQNLGSSQPKQSIDTISVPKSIMGFLSKRTSVAQTTLQETLAELNQKRLESSMQKQARRASISVSQASQIQSDSRILASQLNKITFEPLAEVNDLDYLKKTKSRKRWRTVFYAYIWGRRLIGKQSAIMSRIKEVQSAPMVENSGLSYMLRTHQGQIDASLSGKVR